MIALIESICQRVHLPLPLWERSDRIADAIRVRGYTLSMDLNPSVAVAYQPNFIHALVDDRLIHQRVDLLAIVPADRTGGRRQIHDSEFFFRIDPPVGATGAGPGELPDRSH